MAISLAIHLKYVSMRYRHHHHRHYDIPCYEIKILKPFSIHKHIFAQKVNAISIFVFAYKDIHDRWEKNGNESKVWWSGMISWFAFALRIINFIRENSVVIVVVQFSCVLNICVCVIRKNFRIVFVVVVVVGGALWTCSVETNIWHNTTQHNSGLSIVFFARNFFLLYTHSEFRT